MGFSSNNLPYALQVGLQNLQPKNLATAYRNSRQNKYDYFITDLGDHAQLAPEMLALHKDQQYSLKGMVANIPEQIIFQAGHEKDIKRTIKNKIKMAYHLGFKGVVLNMPNDNPSQLTYYANMLQTIKIDIKLFIRVELTHKQLDLFRTVSTLYGSAHKLLAVLLIVPHELQEGYSKLFDKFLTENIEVLQFSTTHFKNNDKGYPMLHKIQESMAKKAYKYNNPSVCVALGKDEHQTDFIKEYRDYLCYLFQRMPPLSKLDNLTSGYDDQLQEPLQPSIDDLEDEVYSAFEQDTPKYDMYRLALEQAFKQMEKQQYTVYYAGCGRAGILAGLIRAAKDSGVQVQVVLIEKNKQVLMMLREVVKALDNVWILETDIRHFQQNFPKEWLGQVDTQADIVVSELLGGFGDNELSPELIYSIYQQNMLKQGGRSIPEQYSSYVAPVYCPLAYHRVIKQKQVQQPHCVKLKRHSLLANPQLLWQYVHKQYNQQDPQQYDCDRFSVVSFQVVQSSLLQGIAGYFDSILQQDQVISILPGQETKDMLGWFPLLFPLEQAVPVTKGQIVYVSFWRKSTESKVWYEWQVSVYNEHQAVYHSHIHNSQGHALSIYKTK